MDCPDCGTEYGDDGVCDKCGRRRLSFPGEYKHCVKCGSRMSPDARDCPKCGAPNDTVHEAPLSSYEFDTLVNPTVFPQKSAGIGVYDDKVVMSEEMRLTGIKSSVTMRRSVWRAGNIFWVVWYFVIAFLFLPLYAFTGWTITLAPFALFAALGLYQWYVFVKLETEAARNADEQASEK